MSGPEEYIEHNGKLYRRRAPTTTTPALTETPKVPPNDDSYWGGTESWVD